MAVAAPRARETRPAGGGAARRKRGGRAPRARVAARRGGAAGPPKARALVSAPEPVGGRAGEQGVEAVGAEGDDDERGAEQGYLRRDRAARRVDELGQEGQEKERGLGVEDVDDHALREDARQRLRARPPRRAPPRPGAAP